MRIIPIKKATAQAICGSLTQTSKMPCKSLSLPTESCITGSKMSEIDGSICSSCYANKGFYSMYQNTIKPAQFARLDAVYQALESTENAKPVKIPASLVTISGVTASNVHTSGATVHGVRCTAPDNDGACGDCRACWSGSVVSYEMH